MIIYSDKRECTGCGACLNACSRKAIAMKEDREGFLYPEISGELCVECGICRQVCPTASPPTAAPGRAPKVYAAWNLDRDIRFNSTSGGVFAALAAGILNDGGSVAGARYTEDFSVGHHLVHTPEELEPLMQSKYAQSAVGEVFSGIRELLELNRKVLFCGTPCQNAGLRSFLKKDYENLFCCDFICRGVNSPKVYQMYLSSLKKAYSSDIERVWFKNKSRGWNRCDTKVIFRDGRQYVKDLNSDLFAQGYLKYNLFCRPSCYRCRFKGLSRQADLTLADFWGIGGKAPKLDDDKGTSMVMIHTAKGEALFDSIKDVVFYEKRELEDALNSSSMLMHSLTPGKNRRAFFRNIDRLTFEQLMSRYGTYALSEKIVDTGRSIYHSLKSRVT